MYIRQDDGRSERNVKDAMKNKYVEKNVEGIDVELHNIPLRIAKLY